MTPSELTPSQEQAFEAFEQSIMDDLDGKGDRWPENTRFIAADSETAAHDAFASLRKGHSAVLVSAEGVSLCLTPAPVNPFQKAFLRLFARAKVEVTERENDAQMRIKATISEGSLLNVGV